jgi:hypothetical protein
MGLVEISVARGLVTSFNSLISCYWVIGDSVTIPIMFMISSIFVLIIWIWFSHVKSDLLHKVIPVWFFLLLNTVLGILALLATYYVFMCIVELINK